MGINTATAAHADGISAAPARRALRVAADLEKGQRRTGTSGSELAPLTPAALERVESEDEPVRSGGALVHRVVPGSPADAAGLAADDVVVAVGASPCGMWQPCSRRSTTRKSARRSGRTVRRPRGDARHRSCCGGFATRTFDADAEAAVRPSPRAAARARRRRPLRGGRARRTVRRRSRRRRRG